MDVNNTSEGQQVAETTLEEWKKQQEDLQQKVVSKDFYEWQRDRNVSLVGGLDLSFVKGVDDMACAALVVCQLPELNVVYEDVSMVPLTVPYIPGFLAFREAPSLIKAINKLVETKPSLVPQCLLVDGNGILHPRLCGLAVHIGVLCGIPTIGVAKNLFHMDGLQRDEEHMRRISKLKDPGDFFPLETTSGEILGRAVKTCEKSNKPVYVSIGNNISLETATWLVVKCSRYREPEPIRLADMNSREYLRKNYPSTQLSLDQPFEHQMNDCANTVDEELGIKHNSSTP